MDMGAVASKVRWMSLSKRLRSESSSDETSTRREGYQQISAAADAGGESAKTWHVATAASNVTRSLTTDAAAAGSDAAAGSGAAGSSDVAAASAAGSAAAARTAVASASAASLAAAASATAASAAAAASATAVAAAATFSSAIFTLYASRRARHLADSLDFARNVGLTSRPKVLALFFSRRCAFTITEVPPLASSHGSHA
mmetsp:Transcript_25912/g.89402  ORF Transcript_25912/g.89402 Transcript_25912/m.89402 type:complete len:200 (+) Transcript_25912:38-637(+)